VNIFIKSICILETVVAARMAIFAAGDEGSGGSRCGFTARISHRSRGDIERIRGVYFADI
jgi:hypothetical protein